MTIIKKISEPGNEIELIKELFTDYATELNVDLCFQHWDEELVNPLKKYGKSNGSLLLAYWNEKPVGCVALQSLEAKGVCEMKRLYVAPDYRKHGIGELLVKAILNEAKEMGFTKMVLDTLTRLVPAIRLYERYDFVNTSAYYENPLPEVVYMEKVL